MNKLNIKFDFFNPQNALPCAEPRRDVLSVKIRPTVSPVDEGKNQEKKVK